MLYGLFRDRHTESVTFCKSFVKLFNWKKTKSKSPQISLSLSLKIVVFFLSFSLYLADSCYFFLLVFLCGLIFTVIFECSIFLYCCCHLDSFVSNINLNFRFQRLWPYDWIEIMKHQRSAVIYTLFGLTLLVYQVNYERVRSRWNGQFVAKRVFDLI